MNTETWLRGQGVVLRPADVHDFEQLYAWSVSPSVHEWTERALPVPFSVYRESVQRSLTTGLRYLFVIETTDEPRRIGVTTLSLEGSSASLFMAIYPQSDRGRGYGKDAVRTIVDAAFRCLPIERIQAQSFTENERAARVLTSQGFVREGQLRRTTFYDGDYRDMIVFGLTRPDWAAGYGTTRDPDGR